MDSFMWPYNGENFTVCLALKDIFRYPFMAYNYIEQKLKFKIIKGHKI